jgi:hypothetical protein
MMMTTTATDPEATMMMMTTAYMLHNGPTKRGSLQLLLYDLHMRYAEKVVTQLLEEEEDFIPKRKSSGRLRNLLRRWC